MQGPLNECWLQLIIADDWNSYLYEILYRFLDDQPDALQAELDAIRMIECLKRSGLEIKDIRQFFEWVEEGPSTYPNRKAMFEARKKAVEEEMKQLEKTLDMLKFKCWYYEQAIKDGSEDRLKALIPDHLPDGIRKAYENAHS